MNGVRPSDWLWKEGGGYYTQSEEELIKQPLLPDLRRLRDRRLIEVFKKYGNLAAGSAVLEVGCGRSPWLPYLARHERCVAAGIDIEPVAAQLARANLSGSGAKGDILCRDAFELKQNGLHSVDTAGERCRHTGAELGRSACVLRRQANLSVMTSRRKPSSTTPSSRSRKNDSSS